MLVLIQVQQRPSWFQVEVETQSQFSKNRTHGQAISMFPFSKNIRSKKVELRDFFQLCHEIIQKLHSKSVSSTWRQQDQDRWLAMEKEFQ